jgi:hypothetical protein
MAKGRIVMAVTGLALLSLAGWVTGWPPTLTNGASALAAGAPVVAVDPRWPQPLPNNWLLGQAAGVAVDRRDHVWVVQRPKSLTEDERGATLKPPRSLCCAPAPPVLEFDKTGQLVQAWGGPAAGHPWPENEHGIYVDERDHVWLAGNGPRDGMILKFTRDGTLRMKIGEPGVTGNDAAPDTRGNGSTWDVDLSVDAGQTHLYAADGENNQVWMLLRESGRLLGAFGRRGRAAGQFHWVHNLAVDSAGNIYTTEVDSGKRVQKFVLATR